jgi:hypothetical protein
LHKRDARIEQRIDAQRTEKAEQLYAERIALDAKLSQAQQSRSTLAWERAAAVRQRMLSSSLGLNDVLRQKAKTQMALRQTDETFAETRASLLTLAPSLVNMTERQQVKTLMKVLQCSDTEAKEIVEAAREPPSIH